MRQPWTIECDEKGHPTTIQLDGAVILELKPDSPTNALNTAFVTKNLNTLWEAAAEAAADWASTSIARTHRKG